MSMNPKEVLLEQLNKSSENTISALIGIKFTDYENEELTAEMPVTPKVHQPAGILHGGVSSVLAETLGSVLSSLQIYGSGKQVVGTQIISNHLRPISRGKVIGKASFIKMGKKVHLIQIEIRNEEGKLISHNTLKTMVIEPLSKEDSA